MRIFCILLNYPTRNYALHPTFCLIIHLLVKKVEEKYVQGIWTVQRTQGCKCYFLSDSSLNWSVNHRNFKARTISLFSFYCSLLAINILFNMGTYGSWNSLHKWPLHEWQFSALLQWHHFPGRQVAAEVRQLNTRKYNTTYCMCFISPDLIPNEVKKMLPRSSMNWWWPVLPPTGLDLHYVQSFAQAQQLR